MTRRVWRSGGGAKRRAEILLTLPRAFSSLRISSTAGRNGRCLVGLVYWYRGLVYWYGGLV